MCITCGCSPTPGHEHEHGDGHHSHPHDGDHHHGHRHDHHRHDVSTPGTTTISVEMDILAKNDRLAQRNRALFNEKGIFALNLVSSPGSGKTTLLERTLQALDARLSQAVIEGDQQTDNDARRIAATGVPVRQINTGAGCHLDAHMVCHAVEHFDLDALDLLYIENVGNLVCPAAFDLGEHHKVALLSVTEGEDKPLKYPNMFHASDVVLITKTDLLPYVDFDLARCRDMVRRVNPQATIFEVSARTGEGLAAWHGWLLDHAGLRR